MAKIPVYTQISRCRACQSDALTSVLSLGEQYVTDFPAESKEPVAAPLELVLCDPCAGGCGLVQLGHTTNRDLLYRVYWYKSGINNTMRATLAEIAHKAESMVDLKQGDIVLDIGANDGTLLRAYTRPGLRLVGFEPATNLVKEAERGTTMIINEFFGHEHFARLYPSSKCKAVTSIAMFYDLDNPNDFAADVSRSLSDDGVWIIQMNYLPLMIQSNAFDNISHEHLEYYSLAALESILSRNGLEIFELELNEANGGSIRTYVRRKRGAGSKSGSVICDALRQLEQSMRLDERETYVAFENRIRKIRQKVRDFVKSETSRGKLFYVYGASTRGNVVLQFFGLDNTLIKAAAERNPAKWGRRTVGTNIPIVSEDEARADKPDYFLVLPWQFLPEFLLREAEYLRNGGRFVVALPDFQVIGKEGLDNVKRYRLAKGNMLSWYEEQRRKFPLRF